MNEILTKQAWKEIKAIIKNEIYLKQMPLMTITGYDNQGNLYFNYKL